MGLRMSELHPVPLHICVPLPCLVCVCVCVCVCSCVYIVLHMCIRSVPYWVCALGLYCVACVFCAVECLGLVYIVYHMSMPHCVYLLVCLYCLCVHLWLSLLLEAEVEISGAPVCLPTPQPCCHLPASICLGIRVDTSLVGRESVNNHSLYYRAPPPMVGAWSSTEDSWECSRTLFRPKEGNWALGVGWRPLSTPNPRWTCRKLQPPFSFGLLEVLDPFSTGSEQLHSRLNKH